MKIKSAVIFLFALIILIIIPGSNGKACSTIVLKDGKHLVVGKNFDFICDLGTVTVNKRGVIKQALVMPPEKPAKWVSKYGSVTFNQVAREYPMSGINEKGLVIEVMWLKGTAFPAPDERPGISELQWLQYQLDNYSRVEDVIQSDSLIRIDKNSSPIHYLVCDATGNVAVIEFLDGKMAARTGKDLPYPVLTNHTYNQSLEYLETRKGFGGKQDAPFTKNSLDRFTCGVLRVNDFSKRKSEKKVPPYNYAFDALSSIDQGNYTVWTIVYDLKKRVIRFKTVREKDVKIIRLENFDFACRSPVKVLDMNRKLKGDVSGKFGDYDAEQHREMIFKVFRIYKSKKFMTNMPEAALQFLAGYPATLPCKQ